MKFLYPIKKLNIKPWIKYWLIKRLGGESELKVVTISSGKLTKVDKTKPLSVKEYYGNTVQEGTPTPETPIEVQTISGDNEIVVNGNSYRVDLGGKNRLKPLRAVGYSSTNNGITYTWLEGGGIHVQGTATNNSNNQIANNTQEGLRELLLSGNYFLSGSPQGSSSTTYRIQLYGYRENGTGFLYVDNGLKINSFVNTSNSFNIAIFVANGQTVDFIVYPQLEEGNQATEYSPYTDNPIELCKIGNYQDKLYYDSGKWYLHKEVGKVVLNGSETWKRSSVSATNSSAFWNQYVNLNIPVGKYGQKYCDKFEYQEKNWEQSTPNHLAENTNYTSDLSILFNVDSTIATTVSGWTTWLSNNNTTVYYALATPTYTEITDETLISQLEALGNVTVNSSTVIISNDSEIPFEMKIEYYGR